MRFILHRFARLLARLFFRRVVVVGSERIPSAGPLIAVANHINGLVDPLLVYGTLPRPPRTLAKSTLWQMKGLAVLLDLAGVIPVYRRMDEGVDTSKNQDTFDLCQRALGDGDIVALFPEGIAHDFPELQPLRTGAARIALKSEALYGPLGVKIQPMGLTYDDKHTFRSNALVTVGEPFPLLPEGSPFAGRALDDDSDLVLDLTERIDQALREQTLNHQSWEVAERFATAVEVLRLNQQARATLLLLADPGDRGPENRHPENGAIESDLKPALLDHYQLRKALAAVYPRMIERFPEQTTRLGDAIEAYRDALERAGLEHELIATGSRPLRFLRRSLSMVVELVVLLPMAIVGFLLNALPYPLPGYLSRKSGDRHLAATYKAYTSIFIFPLFWTGQAALAWLLGGWRWSIGVLLLAPLGGFVALQFWEGGSDLVRRLKTLARLRRGAERQEIDQLETELRQSLDSLIASVRESDGRTTNLVESA